MGWFKKYVVNPIKKAGKSIAKGFKKVVKGVGDFFTGAVNFVGNLFGFNMAPDPGDYSVEAQQGTTINKQGGSHAIPLHYSPNQCDVGGHLVFMQTDGDKNKFLHLTYVLGYGPVRSIVVQDPEAGTTRTNGARQSNVPFLADWTGDTASNKDGLGNDYYEPAGDAFQIKDGYPLRTVSGGFGGRSYGKALLHNGKSTNFLRSLNGNDRFSDDFHLDKNNYKGLAFVKIRLEYPLDLDTNKFITPFTGLPNFKFKVERAATHRVRSGDNIRTCSANVLYDLLRNHRYGLGLSQTYIDTSSFDALALDSITPRGSTNFNQERKGTYRFNINAPVVENIKNLLYTMGATLVWKDNKFYVKPNPQYGNKGYTSLSTYNINTHTIAEADCIGGISYEIAPADQKFKDVKHQFLGPFGDPIIDSSSVDPKSQDNMVGLLTGHMKTKVDTNATAQKDQSVVGLGNIKLSDVHLLESHYGSTVSITLGAKFSNIEVYDIINVDYARANLSGARYVVLDVEHTSLETVNVRAIRYLFDDDNEGITAGDVIPKLLKGRQTPEDIVKLLTTVPTGFGLDNNTQIDRFISQKRKPSELETLKITTSEEFFKKVYDNKGRPSGINRVKVEWTVKGDQNNTRYSIGIKNLGDTQFDKLFDTNEQFCFIENLEDLTIYYVVVTPTNQTGTGPGRVNKFTTLDSSGPDITNSNKEFLVTGENGEGDGVQTTGSGPENDTYADANNIFSSSYTTRTNRPFGKSPDNFLLTTETGFEETYKQLLAPTDKIGKCWNDFDYSANGGSGSRSDGFAKIESTDQLSPDYTDSDYPSATEANFNARIGTWGGTAWTALENYRTANGDDAEILGQSFRSCIWLSSPNNRAITVSSFEMPCMAGGTEDTGVTDQDHWFEGKVEVAPDKTTSGHTSGDNVFYKQPNCFVYMYASNTNDNVTTFPFKLNTSGNGPFPQFTGILTNWNTSTGDSRVFDSGSGGFSAQLMTGVDMTTYSESSYNSGTKSKALPINAGRYVTPILMFPLGRFFGIRNYNFKIKTEQSVHTFRNIDTSSLSGSTAARTFTWTNPRFGRIKNVQISTNNASSSNIVGYLTADPVDNTQSITFKCIETQNNNNVDARVDITISGYPEVKHIAHTDTLGNTKYIEYKSNFEGTL